MESVQEKTCTKCGVCKPISEFFRSRQSKDGRYSRCKICHKAAATAWKVTHPDRARELDRRARLRNRDARNRYQRDWYRANAERQKKAQREYWYQLKDAAYAAYGGYVCACCGETEPMFLCLDHVDGQGNEHRRQIGGAERLYRWLKVNNYPDGLLQVLCFNCNQGKRLNDNTCPHQRPPALRVVKDVA